MNLMKDSETYYFDWWLSTLLYARNISDFLVEERRTLPETSPMRTCYWVICGRSKEKDFDVYLISLGERAATESFAHCKEQLNLLGSNFLPGRGADPVNFCVQRYPTWLEKSKAARKAVLLLLSLRVGSVDQLPQLYLIRLPYQNIDCPSSK